MIDMFVQDALSERLEELTAAPTLTGTSITPDLSAHIAALVQQQVAAIPQAVESPPTPTTACGGQGGRGRNNRLKLPPKQYNFWCATCGWNLNHHSKEHDDVRHHKKKIAIHDAIQDTATPENPQGGGDPRRVDWEGTWYNYDTGERTATKPKS